MESLGLVQSIVPNGRPYFHENEKKEYACLCTEAITKESKM